MANHQINHVLSVDLRKGLLTSQSVNLYLNDLQINKNWVFYVVAQSRGRCYYSRKVITIPSWAIHKNISFEGYLDWYLSHEMAHAYDFMNKGDLGHGDSFMQELRKICPLNSLKYEVNYKPRNATRNGIIPGGNFDF